MKCVFSVFKIFHFIVWNRRILLNFFANFFSGDEPYPNISYKDLVSKLKSGYRMGKPNNCADSMFVLLVLPLFHFLVFCCFLSSFFSCQYRVLILRYLQLVSYVFDSRKLITKIKFALGFWIMKDHLNKQSQFCSPWNKLDTKKLELDNN